jgi:hypothetical protein
MSNGDQQKVDAAWRKAQDSRWSQKAKEQKSKAREGDAKKKFHEQQFERQKRWEEKGARDEDRKN